MPSYGTVMDLRAIRRLPPEEQPVAEAAFETAQAVRREHAHVALARLLWQERMDDLAREQLAAFQHRLEETNP
jgi:hypothetical protein